MLWNRWDEVAGDVRGGSAPAVRRRWSTPRGSTRTAPATGSSCGCCTTRCGRSRTPSVSAGTPTGTGSPAASRSSRRSRCRSASCYGNSCYRAVARGGPGRPRQPRATPAGRAARRRPAQRRRPGGLVHHQPARRLAAPAGARGRRAARPPDGGTRNLYRLEQRGFADATAWLTGFWDEAEARLRLLAENTTSRALVTELRLERRIALRCPPAHAYDVFVGRIDLWWPRGHRRDPASTILLEPVVGGRLVERSGDQEWLFGTVTALGPPARLAFDWYPGSPGAPTSVEVGFGPGRRRHRGRRRPPGAAPGGPADLARRRRALRRRLGRPAARAARPPPPARSRGGDHDRQRHPRGPRGCCTTPPGSQRVSGCTGPRTPTRPRSWCRSARPSCATTCARSRTCTRCSASTATGCRSATPTSRSRPRTARSRPGPASADNPVGGWYGLKKGLRGRFGNYVPPVLEALGLAELEHQPRNNRMRAR